MNSLIVGLICLCYGWTIVAGNTSACVPGTRFLDTDGCNWCTCSANGKYTTCTMKYCRRPLRQHTRLIRQTEVPEKCVPGTTMYLSDGCNYCECTPHGTVGYCTLMDCGGIVPAPPSPSRQTREVPERCIPGTTVDLPDGCNYCECTPQGTVGPCTLMGCGGVVPAPPKPSRQTRGLPDKCAPGVPVIDAGDGCNTCSCAPDGTVAGCTLAACPGAVPPKHFNNKRSADVQKGCVPGSTVALPDGCNYCDCTPRGTLGLCTMMQCGERVPIPTVSQRQTRSTFFRKFASFVEK